MLNSAVLRAILLTPLILYLGLCVAVVVRQSMGLDPDISILKEAKAENNKL